MEATWHKQLEAMHGGYRKYRKLTKAATRKSSNVLDWVVVKCVCIMPSSDISWKTARYHLANSHPALNSNLSMEDNYMFISPKYQKAILERHHGKQAPGCEGVQSFLLKQLSSAQDYLVFKPFSLWVNLSYQI